MRECELYAFVEYGSPERVEKELTNPEERQAFIDGADWAITSERRAPEPDWPFNYQSAWQSFCEEHNVW